MAQAFGYYEAIPRLTQPPISARISFRVRATSVQPCAPGARYSRFACAVPWGSQTGLRVPVHAPVRESSKSSPSLSWPDQNLLDDCPWGQKNRQQGALGHVLRAQHFCPRFGAGRGGTFVQKGRVDVAGKNCAGTNAVTPFLGVDGLGQSGQTELRHDVSGTGF